MIAVSNRLQVAKGQEKEFEARFEGRARLVENMPGFVRLEILRPLKSDYYIVLTHWKDEESFHAWTESAEFKEAQRIRSNDENGQEYFRDLLRLFGIAEETFFRFSLVSLEVIHSRAVVP